MYGEVLNRTKSEHTNGKCCDMCIICTLSSSRKGTRTLKLNQKPLSFGKKRIRRIYSCREQADKIQNSRCLQLRDLKCASCRQISTIMAESKTKMYWMTLKCPESSEPQDQIPPVHKSSFQQGIAQMAHWEVSSGLRHLGVPWAKVGTKYSWEIPRGTKASVLSCSAMSEPLWPHRL